MRANHRMTGDELVMAQLHRRIQNQYVDEPLANPDASIEVMAYLVIAGVVWTAVILVYWLL